MKMVYLFNLLSIMYTCTLMRITIVIAIVLAQDKGEACGTQLGFTVYCPSGHHCCDIWDQTCCEYGYSCDSGNTCSREWGMIASKSFKFFFHYGNDL